MRYPIVVHKDKRSCYGATVPDLPGCFSAGDSLDEAIEAAHEAIAFHVEGLLMQGEPIPAPSPLEVHQADENLADGVFAIVTVDISKLSSKTMRVNITVPARVLAIIDEAASREGETRSGLIVQAALRYVEQQTKAGIQSRDSAREHLRRRSVARSERLKSK